MPNGVAGLQNCYLRNPITFMQKKPHFKLAMAIFSAFMALLYLGIGIYMVFGDRQFVDQVINPGLMKVFGAVLILMGVLRGLRSYQLFNIYRDVH